MKSRTFFWIGRAALAALPLLFISPSMAKSMAQTGTPPLILLGETQAKELHGVPSEQVMISPGVQTPNTPNITVTIRPGKADYPGLSLKPEKGKWDLSAYGHVEARLVNTGMENITLALRVDNDADGKTNLWNTETITLAPGETRVLKTIFGYAYGYKRGYALKPAAVSNIFLFAAKSEQTQSFRLESLVASGPAGEKPPVAPEAVRLKPKNSFLWEPAESLIPSQIFTRGSHALVTGKGLQVVFPARETTSVSLRPREGRWDLRDALEVRVRVRNTGKTTVSPRTRIETEGGPSQWFRAMSPLAPGTERELIIPFVPAVPPNLGKPETRAVMSSDAVSAVTLEVEKGSAGESSLTLSSLRAGMPPPPALPGGLGERPPAPGDWAMTFRDEFSGSALDTTLWNNEGENYYDKTTHWSKANVLIGGGFARLRYEKKTGFHNDDPKRNQTNYAAGYLNGYQRWAQRYGYFEARMKLPTAPGLWPTFWLMPDRGAVAGAAAADRQNTGNNGMEFDIMEHLTRWGPTRYNVAMHFDGYGADHKQIGTDHVYIQPDKDGFITCGLLWTPGLAVYYCNGKEVLRWENARISRVPSAMMLTLPSGGWDNNALDDTKLPADFVIDYVRVWQRKDLASPADSAPRLKR